MAVNEGYRRDNAERDAEIYRLYVVNRLTMTAIAARHGITVQRVDQIIGERKKLVKPPDLTAIRDKAMALHEDVIRRAYELVEMAGAPVTAGKDGLVVYDPEVKGADGKPVVVRDYAARLAALKVALDADREMRKLTGADAASKTEISGGVKYEVVGIDVDQDLK